MIGQQKIYALSLSLLIMAFSGGTSSSQPQLPNDIKAIGDAIDQGEINLTDFLIARVLGASFKNDKTFETHRRLVPSLRRHPGWAPTHFISGRYSDEFIDFFSRGSWSMWGGPSRSHDRRHKKIVLKEAKHGDTAVVIWGTPTYRNWYVIAPRKITVLTVIGSHDTWIIFGKRNTSGKWDDCKRNDMNREGSIQYVWKPQFIDLDNDGERELLVRYNVMMADGYRQILDIYDISSFCQPELLRTFIGIHGIATQHRNSIVVSDETSLDGKAILSQDRQKFRSFRLEKGAFIKISETLEDNFLWEGDWMKRVKAVAEKMRRKDL